MTRKEVTVHFQRLAAARIAMEAGTHSGWVSRLLESFGHEVLVANVCETPGISHSHRKSDPVDAEKLARYARVDPRLLSPIRHRTEETQQDLVLIRVRERFIAARTMFINAARGIVKSLGYRLPCCGADAFAKRCRLHLPTRVAEILAPLLSQVSARATTVADQANRIDLQEQGISAALRRCLGIENVGLAEGLVERMDAKRTLMQ